jgi:septal ring factor EnvC (AmiA/AmiB activator)
LLQTKCRDADALAILSGEAIMDLKQKLMACTALLGVWLLVPTAATAQSSEAAKIERLERQTELLQRQLKEIQEELARTRKKTERVEAKVEAAPARLRWSPRARQFRHRLNA